MDNQDRQRFSVVLTGMAKLYERQIDTALLEAYWLGLRDWTLADFEQAAGHLMATSEFMPRPAAFNALRKAAKPAVAEAWQMARNSIQYTPHGYIEKPGIDPLISAALRVIGGANALAMCPADKITFLEKRFSEAYANLDATTVTREALPSVAKPQISDEQAAANRKRLSQLLELAS